MRSTRRWNPRLIAVVVLALLVLGTLILATGGSFLGSSGGQPAVVTPSAEVSPLVIPAAQVRGRVTVTARRLHGHTWQFVYTVYNTGKAPIAGFQLNQGRSNLFHISGRAGWNRYGAGVCGGKYPGVLIYWSTGATSRSVLPPGHAGRFTFQVNTSGTVPAGYSLSWASSALFGTTTAPAPSTLPAPGHC